MADDHKLNMKIGFGTYVFFAVMNLVLIMPGTYFLFPETKKYSLEDVSSSTPDSLRPHTTF